MRVLRADVFFEQYAETPIPALHASDGRGTTAIGVLLRGGVDARKGIYIPSSHLSGARLYDIGYLPLARIIHGNEFCR
jgi:hypothetical protein